MKFEQVEFGGNAVSFTEPSSGRRHTLHTQEELSETARKQLLEKMEVMLEYAGGNLAFTSDLRGLSLLVELVNAVAEGGLEARAKALIGGTWVYFFSQPFK